MKPQTSHGEGLNRRVPKEKFSLPKRLTCPLIHPPNINMGN